ncbi:MAG: hypothetical protein ACR2JK_14515, partial [Geodermatophilaceae bacterium]
MTELGGGAARAGDGTDLGEPDPDGVAELADQRLGDGCWDGCVCERERTDAELTETIREIHAELHGHPGVRRVWAELVVRGVRIA